MQHSIGFRADLLYLRVVSMKAGVHVQITTQDWLSRADTLTSILLSSTVISCLCIARYKSLVSVSALLILAQSSAALCKAATNSGALLKYTGLFVRFGSLCECAILILELCRRSSKFDRFSGGALECSCVLEGAPSP